MNEISRERGGGGVRDVWWLNLRVTAAEKNAQRKNAA